MSSHEHYLKHGEEYDKNLYRILPNADLFFSTCLSFLPKSPISLLELGSGTGFFTAYMLCNFPQYRITCIDKSDEMLKMAQMKTQLKGCKFIKGDITEGLPAEMFDGVVTTLTLHHISDSSRKKLVNEIYRALHPRGLFICGDVFKPEEDWIEVIYQSRWENHMRKTGMPEEQIHETLSGREKAWPLIDTMHGFYEKMKTAGFTRIFIPLQYDMFGVFIGMK